MTAKQRVMSGMRPTGRLHLGNYFGALDSWLKLQGKYECFHSIVDWHALTTAYQESDDIKDNILQMAIDWLSVGLDPNKSAVYVQSRVKEIAELHLLLSMIVPVSWLERCPTYKDQLVQLKDKEIATYGFLGYPNLMASDILICKASIVPVGEDQLPHLELAREIVRRFNFLYGETFPEPQALLNDVKVLPGLDGRKMSKSYGNTILLSEDPESARKKISMMITDPARIKKDDPGHPDICSVFAFHKVFSPDIVQERERECKAGQIGCVQCKRQLADNVVAFLEPIYERRKELEKNIDYVHDVLDDGYNKIKPIAQKTIEEVRTKMGL
jgi:tryptophanyl-tRNA synthetase